MPLLSEFRFNVVYNCDYALSGLLSSKQFVLLGIFVMAFTLYFLLPRLRSYKLGTTAMILLVFGGLLNGVERLSTGCVKDYFNFLNLFHFNVADLLVSAGILLSVYIIWKKK
jgi:lipoprotein signal peptidase